MQLKFVLSPLVLAVGLSGCQITDEQTLESSTNDQALASCNELHTTEEAISDCEIARDGVIEVVHPNDALLDEAQEIVDTQNIETQAVIPAGFGYGCSQAAIRQNSQAQKGEIISV